MCVSEFLLLTGVQKLLPVDCLRLRASGEGRRCNKRRNGLNSNHDCGQERQTVRERGERERFFTTIKKSWDGKTFLDGPDPIKSEAII